jgi:hypothetical protein
MGAIARGNWLPALPDGSFMGPRPADLQQRYKDLYGKFGDAWRVTNATTLFDYAPGTSTGTFTIAGWPKGESPQSCTLPRRPEGMKPPVKALALEVAQKHCSTLVAGDARANCIQDVRVTGEPGFARTYLLAERIARNAIPTAPVLVFPENFKTDLVKPIAFTWNKATDLDGDPLTYRHCVWEVKQRYTFKDCDAAAVQTASWDRGILYAALAALLGCVLFAVLIFMGMKNRRGLLILVAIAVLAAVILAFYIGWTQTPSRTVSALESGKAYYWKVIAEDGKGGSAESETRRFTIE